ncbi:MAG: hypothetical protein HY739_11770 [Desulfobacterales bacterium]|nr:hypothetical protein [Desulfobacterales bacterium]
MSSNFGQSKVHLLDISYMGEYIGLKTKVFIGVKQMAEIKSTLELAMERAKKIEVSPEEKEQLKRGEYASKAKGILNRYLNEDLNIKGLIKELASYDGNARDTIVGTLLLELIDTIDISIDNKRSLEAIDMLKQNRVKPTLDRINKLCKDFNEEKGSRYKKIEKEIRKRLDGMGISGTAVQPVVDYDERWYDVLANLSSEYEAKLVKLKGELLNLDAD